jgi:hypothetical protein
LRKILGARWTGIESFIAPKAIRDVTTGETVAVARSKRAGREMGGRAKQSRLSIKLGSAQKSGKCCPSWKGNEAWVVKTVIGTSAGRRPRETMDVWEQDENTEVKRLVRWRDDNSDHVQLWV